MKITVETTIQAAIAQVWHAYTTPEHIVEWNAASDDWHTTSATVELREGGAFSSRMEAKDGSTGFDFAGMYTKVVTEAHLAYTFGDRVATVDFTPSEETVVVSIHFDAEDLHPVEMQKAGWQAILDNFKRYVESK